MESILFYVNSLCRGGAERVFSALANMFAKDNYRVVFVTSFTDEEWEYPLRDEIKRYSMEDRKTKQSFLKRNISRTNALRSIIKAEKPDLLLSTSPEANFRSIIASAGTNTKTVITIISDPNKEYSSFLYRLLARKLYCLADGVVFQTREEMAWFPRRIQEKAVLLFNQVDERFFMQYATADRRNIVSVGRLIPMKRHEDIIRAFKQIYDKVTDNLVIYGDGPCRDSLEELVHDLKLEGRVFLPGRVDDVAAKTYDAKLFVLASEYEGLPNALMEAMALGTPCLSTDCSGGGVNELLLYGEYGIIVPVHDVDAIAEQMMKVLSDKSLVEELSTKARARAENFRSERIFRQWAEYLAGISQGA